MKQKFPEAITIILIIMVVFMALTWIIPAGEFQYEVVNGRNYLIPGSFRFTEISPQGPASFLMAPIKGFVQAGLIIGFCFLVGGSFGILNKTGAIDAGLFEMLRRTSGKKSSRKMVIVLMMLIFSVCGATFGMSESVLVFIMITIPMARAMGYDSITGLSVSFLAAGVGFAGALTNPFTIGIAQGIAGLPIFSGWEYRLLVWLVFTTAAIVFVLVYIRKIEKDPSKSPVYELDAQAESSSVKQDEIPFNFSRKVVVILLFLVLGLIIYGSNRWKWYINEISAVFLALGIL
ncbi:MAG: YfcC family protein, partial [Lentimicrobium sp.]|nr:YfcC family protein [Lentimicrobium sp.]